METNSEDNDFRVGSELFFQVSRRFNLSIRRLLGLLVNHGGQEFPSRGGCEVMTKDLLSINSPNFGKGQFLVYEAEDGRVKIDVRLEDETVWLTQQLMADLFQTTKQNIGQHLKNIFSEGELLEVSVVKKFFTTAADGKKYKTNFYNLDMIISVGYRVKSHVATRFRIWATQRLREYIVKGSSIITAFLLSDLQSSHIGLDCQPKPIFPVNIAHDA